MTWPNSVPNLAASPNLYTTSPILWSKAPASLCQVLATSAACLAYFDVTAPLILLVDASDYGLGVALLQPIILHNSSALDKSSLRPTAYSRRPNHEQRKIEKKRLAIVEAIKKFHPWLLGKSNTQSI